MARTKEFDPDVALRAAMDLFWRKGYEATSMQDIVDHLGIGRGSIYATFGSKHELYLRALDRYTERFDGRALDQLSRSGPALPAVREFVRLFLVEALADPRGCLVTNTAVECPQDQPSARRVEFSWNGLETALAGALTRARNQDELAAGKDPRALARFLVTFLQGLRVMAKVPDERRMRDAVDQALTVLD
ncbi:TetR/AcrR family transcriptional regulator [Actinophytocola sp.]|uniref:TetR/AcrR family transcriptional regulator n=1 Tax=Actinophytocola sp. TaxID=1872138 RepID=UPI00389AECC4